MAAVEKALRHVDAPNTIGVVRSDHVKLSAFTCGFLMIMIQCLGAHVQTAKSAILFWCFNWNNSRGAVHFFLLCFELQFLDHLEILDQSLVCWHCSFG